MGLIAWIVVGAIAVIFVVHLATGSRGVFSRR